MILLRSQPSLLPECCVQQVAQPNTRSLEPIPDERDVLSQICDIHDDHFLVITLREGLVPLLIDALRPNLDAILHGLPARDLERLVRPARDWHRNPRGPVAVG